MVGLTDIPLKGFCIVNLNTMRWAFEPEQYMPEQQFDWFVPAFKKYLIDRCRKTAGYDNLFRYANVTEVRPNGEVWYNALVDIASLTFPVDPDVNELSLQIYSRDELFFALQDGPSVEIQQHVLDWMVGLQGSADVNGQALFAKIGPKMTFEHAIKHSERWHAAMAKKAEKRRKLGIVDDDPGCPVCLQLDGEFQGWTWRWLKSNEARDSESDAMGHCVGRGGYAPRRAACCGKFWLTSIGRW
jgi:hypothetical protein